MWIEWNMLGCVYGDWREDELVDTLLMDFGFGHSEFRCFDIFAPYPSSQ